MDFVTNIQLYNTSIETPLLDVSKTYQERQQGDQVYEKFDQTLEKAMKSLKDVNTQAEIEMEIYLR